MGFPPGDAALLGADLAGDLAEGPRGDLLRGETPLSSLVARVGFEGKAPRVPMLDTGRLLAPTSAEPLEMKRAPSDLWRESF